MRRRTFCLAAAAAGSGIVLGQTKGPRTIDDFFREFTDEWVRNDPTLATEARYFTGAEQDKLERMVPPPTAAEARKRVALARKGLKELRAFDRSKLSPTQALAAEVMEWQLQIAADEEPFLDYWFPFEQMNGWNVAVVENFTVGRPLAKARDAENYVAALALVGPRTEDAIAEAKRVAAKGIIPPRFILQSTLKQMRSFADSAPASNPFVTTLNEKMAAMTDLTPGKRDQLRAEAEKIVGTQIYPADRKSTRLNSSH